MSLLDDGHPLRKRCPIVCLFGLQKSTTEDIVSNAMNAGLNNLTSLGISLRTVVPHARRSVGESGPFFASDDFAQDTKEVSKFKLLAD